MSLIHTGLELHDCLDCGGKGTFCPSVPDKCSGCEICERCKGSGNDPETFHEFLSGTPAEPIWLREARRKSGSVPRPAP